MYCLVSMSLQRFLGNGPLWPIMNENLSGHCTLNWWSTLLYVQNYVNPNAIVSIRHILFELKGGVNFFLLNLFTSTAACRQPLTLSTLYDPLIVVADL